MHPHHTLPMLLSASICLLACERRGDSPETTPERSSSRPTSSEEPEPSSARPTPGELVEISADAAPPVRARDCRPELHVTPARLTLTQEPFHACLRAHAEASRVRQWQQILERDRQRNPPAPLPWSLDREGFDAPENRRGTHSRAIFIEPLRKAANDLIRQSQRDAQLTGLAYEKEIAVRIAPQTPMAMIGPTLYTLSQVQAQPVLLARDASGQQRRLPMRTPQISILHGSLNTLAERMGPACIDIHVRVLPDGRVLPRAVAYIQDFSGSFSRGGEKLGEPRSVLLSVDGASCPVEPGELPGLLEALPDDVRFCEDSHLLPSPEASMGELVPVALELHRALSHPITLVLPPEDPTGCQDAPHQDPSTLPELLEELTKEREIIVKGLQESMEAWR